MHGYGTYSADEYCITGKLCSVT